MSKDNDAAVAEAPEEAVEEQQEQAQAPAQQQQQQLQVDDSQVIATYANFCRVTGSPEELIIDFGLNPQPMMGIPKNPIPVAQRVIVNFYTAKRLLAALNMSIQRHEQVFGVLETDVNKRLKKS
jgi:precorrin-6B methylase 2